MTDIKLKVNEKKIPLNDLMENMLTNLVLAYLKSAKGIPDEIKSLSINIKL